MSEEFWKGVAITMGVLIIVGGLVALFVLTNNPSQNEPNEPDNSQVQASIGDDPVIGQENATLTLIKFTDFGCPYCKSWYDDTYPYLKENYVDTGKLKIAYKDTPVEQTHPQAPNAHAIANCVYEQHGDSAYFDLVEKIYGNQNTMDFTRDNLINLTDYDVSECSDKSYDEEFSEDMQEAQQANMKGTPHFVLMETGANEGVAVGGAQPPQVFENLIEPRLENE